jgi:hypothetical protein
VNQLIRIRTWGGKPMERAGEVATRRENTMDAMQIDAQKNEVPQTFILKPHMMMGLIGVLCLLANPVLKCLKFVRHVLSVRAVLLVTSCVSPFMGSM